MKKLILTLCCLAIMVPNSWDLFGQDRHTALYSYTERNAMTGRVTNDIIRLNSEKGYFSCVSENTYQKDLVQDSLVQTGLDPYTIVAMTRDMARGQRTRIFTDLAGNTRTVYEFPMTQIHYEEPLPVVTWELSDEVKEVNGIPSKQARGKLYGREWIVSYATDIPLPVGPWKLTGLPGLVTEAVTTDSLYHFTLISFALTPDDERPIIPSPSAPATPSKKQSKKEVLNALHQCATNNRAWLKKIYPVSSQPEETPEDLRRMALARKSYQYIERAE
ncbi:MAG: GLPGLI family protein [Porphyromonas sp.]|uniref:GLPGLI family protein n=1 Tax=Porphyromonas sp. TaxID=1924944 RepID=UPI002A9087F8|nr:GLPGLI family protein [Porphyromonas sp.]MDD7469026.1 GLPGLI family protein [Bacteroidales bacterium]MDY6102515.1 GLPGLI family protein [Porphyromonas sp.]